MLMGERDKECGMGGMEWDRIVEREGSEGMRG